MEQRAGLEHEGTVLRTVNICTGKVGRKKVRGKLNTVKTTFDAFSQELDGTGLCQSWRSFYKNVAISEQRCKQSVYQFRLADDVAVHILANL